MPIKVKRTEILWQCGYCHKFFCPKDYSRFTPKELLGLAKEHEAKCPHSPRNRRCAACASSSDNATGDPNGWGEFGCLRSGKQKADGDTCRYWTKKGAAAKVKGSPE